MKIRIMSFTGLVLMASLAMADEQPATARGKELFNSTTLGTNGKSCAGCHANGSGLNAVKTYDAAELGKIVNQCIAKALEGTPLPADSADLDSLVNYLQSLPPAAP